MPDYWRTALIRAARTAAQTFVAVMMANQAGMFEADALMVLLKLQQHQHSFLGIQNALEDAPFPFMSKIPKG